MSSDCVRGNEPLVLGTGKTYTPVPPLHRTLAVESCASFSFSLGLRGGGRDDHLGLPSEKRVEARGYLVSVPRRERPDPSDVRRTRWDGIRSNVNRESMTNERMGARCG